MSRCDWLIVELSDQAETASYPELVAAVGLVFGSSIDYFIPIHYEQMGSYASTNVLFDGYVFIKDSEDVRARIINIRDSRFFQGILRSSGKICIVKSSEIGTLKRRLNNSLKKKYKEGSKVKILEGIFQNLEGEVLSTENSGRVANVKVRCLSREIIAPIPTTCIEEITDDK